MPKRRAAEPGLSKTSEPGISRYVGPRGTTYRVRVSSTDPATGARQWISNAFPTFEQARDFKTRTLHELRAGIYTEPCMEPLSDILAHWLETARLATRSRITYANVIQHVIAPQLGKIPLSSLTGRQIQELYNAPRGASQAVQVQAALNGALELAVREGLINRNPAAGLRVARRHDDRPGPPPLWTAAELNQFLDATTGHNLGPLFHTAAHTGLRLSELIALNWADVSLDLGRLLVRQSKSKAGERRVPLNAVIVARLRAHRAEQDRRRDLLADAWQGDGNVFDRGDGRRVSPRTVEAWMERTVARLGLPHATPHSLRHFWASALIAAGVPMTTVQTMLGHASFSTTADFYIHHAPADERDAVAVLEATLCNFRDTIPAVHQKTASE